MKWPRRIPSNRERDPSYSGPPERIRKKVSQFLPFAQRQLKEKVSFADAAKISSTSAPARSRRKISRACSSGWDLSTAMTSAMASFRRLSSSQALFSALISHWGSLYSQWTSPPARVWAAQLLQGRCPSHYRQVGIISSSALTRQEKKGAIHSRFFLFSPWSCVFGTPRRLWRRTVSWRRAASGAHSRATVTGKVGSSGWAGGPATGELCLLTWRC